MVWKPGNGWNSHPCTREFTASSTILLGFQIYHNSIPKQIAMNRTTAPFKPVNYCKSAINVLCLKQGSRRASTVTCAAGMVQFIALY